MEGNASIPKTELARLMKVQAHMDLLDAMGVDNWEGYKGPDVDNENDIDRQVEAMPCTDWQPVTKTEPADRDPNVLLACNGQVIGMMTARWTDEQDGEQFENWKVDDNLWDGDNDPTHCLRIPAPPTDN